MKKILILLLCIVLFASCFNILGPRESFSIIGKWANPTPYLVGQGDRTYDTLSINSNGRFLWSKTTFNGCPYPGATSTICDGWYSKSEVDSGSYTYENDSLFLYITKGNKTFGVSKTSSSDEMLLSGGGYNSLLFNKFQ